MPTALVKTSRESSARSPEREELAAAIARRREVERDIADRRTRIAQLRGREDELQESLNAATETLEKSRNDYVEWATNSAFVIGVTARQARQAVEDAEEALAICRGARKAAEDELRELEGVLAIVSVLAREIGAVLQNDPAIRRLCEAYEQRLLECEGMRQALDVIRLRRGLPPQYAHILSRSEIGLLPQAKAWQAALAELERDANAQLPAI